MARLSALASTQQFYTRLLDILVAVAVGLVCWLVLKPILEPVCWAFILAILLEPAKHHLPKFIQRRRSLAAILLTVATLVLVVAPVTGLMVAFGQEFKGLVQQARATNPAPGQVKVPELQELPVAGPSLEELRKELGISPGTVRSWMTDTFNAGIEAVGPFSGKVVLGAFSAAAAFAIMMVVLFFAVRDGPEMLEKFADLLPWTDKVKRDLAKHLVDVLRAVVFGTGITAVLQGLLVGAAFAVLELPGPVVFGALAALLAVLPVGGTALVWGPAALALAVQGRVGAAVGLLLFGTLLVGTVDNLLRPVLVSGRTHVGALVVFVGVIGGIAAFGLLGVIIGPLALSLAGALLALLRETPATDPPPG